MKLCHNKKNFYFLILIFILILSSCTTSLPAEQPVLTITPNSVPTFPIETETISTPTETPQIKNIILLLKDESFTNEETDINDQLEKFAQSRASNYEIIRSFEEDLISTAELVVVMTRMIIG